MWICLPHFNPIRAIKHTLEGSSEQFKAALLKGKSVVTCRVSEIEPAPFRAQARLLTAHEYILVALYRSSVPDGQGDPVSMRTQRYFY